jgi:hypothetical protein
MSSSLPLAAALCGTWLLHVVLVRGVATIDRTRVVLAAVALMGVSLLAFAAGQFAWFPTDGAPLPAQVVQLGIFLLSALLFLAVGHQVTTLAQLRWLTWLFIGVGLFAAVIQAAGVQSIARWTTRPGSIGSLFWTWLVAVTASQALFNRRLSTPVRLGLLGITALVLGHGLLQARSWASGWLPPLVALGTIVLLRLPRLSIAAGALAVPIGLIVSSQLASAVLAEEEYSLMTRREAWNVLWQVVERSPIVGTGLANYYYYTENFSLLGWYVRFISHNNYQDLIVQTGFLGLVVFGWFAFEAGWLALRLYRRLPPGFPRAYAAGAFGGLAGSLAAGMLGDWIIPFYYNGGVLGFRSSLLFWVFLGGLLPLTRLLARTADAETRSYVPSRGRLPIRPRYSPRALTTTAGVPGG